jgi:hypothetical protein
MSEEITLPEHFHSMKFTLMLCDSSPEMRDMICAVVREKGHPTYHKSPTWEFLWVRRTFADMSEEITLPEHFHSMKFTLMLCDSTPETRDMICAVVREKGHPTYHKSPTWEFLWVRRMLLLTCLRKLRYQNISTQ